MAAGPCHGPLSCPPPLTPVEAFGGPWAFGVVQWALTLAPATLLVGIQEAAGGGFSLALVLQSALAQHAVAGAIGLPVAAWLRVSRSRLRLPATVAVWGAIGAARGGVGGLVAGQYGLPEDFAFRVLFWLAVGWIWAPLLGWFLVQLGHRRRLLSMLLEAESAREESQSRASRSSEEVRSSLLFSLSGTIFAGVRDIRSSLARLPASDLGAMSAIGERLSSLTAKVSETVDNPAGAPEQAGHPRPSLAPVAAALAFERRQPMQWAAMSGGAALSVTLPIALHAGRPLLALHLLIAVLAASSILALGPGSARRAAENGAFTVRVPLRYAAAAGAGGLLLIMLGFGSLERLDLLMAVVVSIGMLCSAALTSAAVGCAHANRALIGQIASVAAERSGLEVRARREEEQVRAGLRTLLHGPIQGRLAACAMAINFHAAGDSGAGDAVVAAVVNHLDLVEQDLAVLEAELLLGRGTPGA